MRKHLTYANVVSTICLFVVLGGTSVAAVTLTRPREREGEAHREERGDEREGEDPLAPCEGLRPREPSRRPRRRARGAGRAGPALGAGRRGGVRARQPGREHRPEPLEGRGPLGSR